MRVLFDNGSQKTYISNRLRDRLKLKPVKTETLQLNTFGDNRFKKLNCDVVELELQSQSGESVKISATCYPVICSPLPTKMNVDYPHLKGLNLAEDFNDGNDTIDILLGSDVYWEVVTGEVIKGQSGPVAVKSIFGWLLSGKIDSYAPRYNTSTSALIISGICDPLTNYDNANEDELLSTMKNFWEIESVGIHNVEDEMLQPKDFIRDIRFSENRYQSVQREPI